MGNFPVWNCVNWPTAGSNAPRHGRRQDLPEVRSIQMLLIPKMKCASLFSDSGAQMGLQLASRTKFVLRTDRLRLERYLPGPTTSRSDRAHEFPNWNSWRRSSAANACPAVSSHTVIQVLLHSSSAPKAIPTTNQSFRVAPFGSTLAFISGCCSGSCQTGPKAGSGTAAIHGVHEVKGRIGGLPS
jgi:hypothetical protein